MTRLLKTARGQLDGLLKMVDDDRYCIDISDQLMATMAILNGENLIFIYKRRKSAPFVFHIQLFFYSSLPTDKLISSYVITLFLLSPNFLTTGVGF